MADLVNEAEADIRRSPDAGAHRVQLDFTEGRLSLKPDPSGGLLRQFVDLDNAVLERFTARERAKIGVHTCPGGDLDSAHSLDVDHAGLLPAVIRDHRGADQRIFVGVIDPRVETPEEVPAGRPPRHL